ncbi:response regulator transcription factor [Streptomyces sp. Amel2xC10]|uniref:response regulator transcription factor n=1 Tax=Streptomyces sp. Amel2xC10 TaxID=1305826 RepID=UPI000A086853|nr:LuxR C-terminal-related transcriptional regulator [Streptomyces sp. Amel2xC10]SMF86021.1 Response regulator containing a CheY-like receiver domain and an HTH DNA-binding domain [Streptomyces sp. Amel2xC10]
MADDFLVFPWARAFDDDQLAAFLEDLWAAASGESDLTTLDAVEKVIASHRPDRVTPLCTLTPRERELLTQFATGATHDTAAANLGVTPLGVKSIVPVIKNKLRARTMAQATAAAIHHGWLPGVDFPDPPQPLTQHGPIAWRARYATVLAELRAAPGTTGDVGPYSSLSGARNGAWRVNKGLLAEAQPAGAFEAQDVRVSSGRWVVRIRYGGESDPTEAPR